MQRIGDDRAEAGVVERGTCGAEDAQPGGQQPVAMQAVQRRQQHALREVAGGTEDRQQRGGSGNGKWAHVSAAAVGCDPAPTSRVGCRR